MVSNRMFLCVALLSCVITASCSKSDRQVVDTYISDEINTVVSVPHVMATIAGDELPGGLSEHEISQLSTDSNSDFVIDINKYGKGIAYIARVGERYCVVHNGKRGAYYDKIDSYTLLTSPDGKRVAYGAQKGDKHYVIIDGVEKGPFDDRGRIAFSPDSKHVGYDAKSGIFWYMYIDHVKHGGAFSYFDRSVFNSDSDKLIYIEVTEVPDAYRLNIFDLKSRQNIAMPIVDPAIVTNEQRTAVAAVEKTTDGFRVLSFDFKNPHKVFRGDVFDRIGQLTYNNDGSSLAYVAVKDDKSYIVLNDKKELLPTGDYPWPFAIRPRNGGVGIFIVNTLGKRRYNAYLHNAFTANHPKNKVYKEGAHLTYSIDGSHYAYVAIENEKFTVVVDGKEGPFYDMAVHPQFSPDGKYIVYRARQDGKRFVVISSLNGKVIKRLPTYEMVFDLQFTEDGSSVAYAVKTGNQFIWKVEKL